MRNYTTETVERKKLESITCDWCERKIEEKDSWFVIVDAEDDDTFPDAKGLASDLCMNCVTQFKALLIANGIKSKDLSIIY